MPKENTSKKHDEPQRSGSAPELPHAVARQYGLHHEAPGDQPDTSKTVSAAGHTKTESVEPADDASKETQPTTGTDNSAPDTDTEKVLEDSKTDEAVDDILSKEGDALLDMQNGSLPHAEAVVAPKKRGFWRSIGHFFAAWWHNKWARWITIAVLLAAIGALAAIPKARYAVLNTVGVRSSASLTVLDETTQLPLKNVTVTLNAQKQTTNSDGVARFSDLKLGTYTLTIKRIAFAQHTERVTIGLGSNPLGSFKLQATGLQYTILVSDYVTGQGFAGAEATSDQAVAQSDKMGKIILTVADSSATTLTATVTASGYRSEQVHLNADTAAQAKVMLVPAPKEVFVSKASGRYDVCTIDLDGANRKVLLAGTGNEGSNISLVVSPDGKRAALVSTRDNIRDSDGFLLQALTIINIDDGTSVTVDHAEQIQLVDWQGNRVIYRMTLAGASAADSQRSRLISYDYNANARLQLATANQFNAIFSAGGMLYYTVSSTDPHATLGLFKVKPDGSNKQRLTQDEIWTALRTTYGTVSLQTPSGWSNFNLLTGQSVSANAPPNTVTYLFAENNQTTQSAWVDVRDGNGTLLLHDDAKNSDKTLRAQDGLTYPVRFITDGAITYRVANNAETADYVIGTNGGAPHKITDVTPTYGYAQIY